MNKDHMRTRISQASTFEAFIALLLVAGFGVFVARHAFPSAPVPAASPRQEASSPVSEALLSDIVDSGVPMDGIPSLDSPSFVPTSQALRELSPDGHGLVFVKGSTARFYPYQILAWHEVVNDIVNGEAVAVTYCALCNVGVVYGGTLDGSPMSFGVSGKLEGLDSLLFDRGTHSLWSQVTGKALAGPLVGRELVIMPSTVLTLAEFGEQYPFGAVLSKFTGFVRNYDRLAYGDIATQVGGDKVIAAQKLLHPKTDVIGIRVGATTKAYVLDRVKERGVIRDVVGNATVLIAHGNNGEISIQNAATSQPMEFVRMYWFMWQAWNPDTRVYQ